MEYWEVDDNKDVAHMFEMIVVCHLCNLVPKQFWEVFVTYTTWFKDPPRKSPLFVRPLRPCHLTLTPTSLVESHPLTSCRSSQRHPNTTIIYQVLVHQINPLRSNPSHCSIFSINEEKLVGNTPPSHPIIPHTFQSLVFGGPSLDPTLVRKSTYS